MTDEPAVDSFEALLRKVAAAPEVSLPLELKPGEVLDDNFEIVERVGAGGMGVVYRARDRRLGREIAIKLHVGHTDDRLMSEAVAMAKLSHPNVITVHEIGTYKDHLFIAMEFVDGDTARGWLEGGERSVDEIIDVFCQAGRGLEAAHEAGMVHRDFKPDNVFIGADGRVAVGDFGLARPVGERARGAAGGDHPTPRRREPLEGEALKVQGSERSRADSLTATDQVIGTLAYMAPEQIAGVPVDARADQFAFAVSLWEGLSGVRPFDDASLTSRGRSLEEPLALPALPDEVPRRVAAALERALAVDRDDRFPSMTELLSHVAPAPRPSRGGWIAFALAAAAAIGAVAYAAAGRPAAGPSCAPVDPSLGSIWSGDRRAAIERAFSATELSYAPGTFAAVSKLAGDYAAAIAVDRERACRESRGDRAGISTALYQRRLGCLRRRERSLDSLLDIFEDADRQIVAAAVDAAGALPPVSACGDETFLASEIEPPEDARVAREVADIRAAVGRAESLSTAGKLGEARAAITKARERARAVGYRPVLAEALLVAGRIEARGDDFAAATKSLRQGYLIARRAGADALAGELAARLALVLGAARADRAGGALWSELATIEVDRGVGSDALELDVLQTLGELADIDGDYDRALDYFERARVLALGLYADDHPVVLDIAARRAATLHGKGELDQSAAAYEQALAGLERSRGDDHPDVGMLLRSFGLVNANRGEAETARRQLERSHAILSRALGPRALDTGYAVLNLGVAHHAAKDYREAIGRYTLALEIITERLGAEHPDVALCLNSLAVAHEGLGELDEAIGYLDRALAMARMLGEQHPQVATVLANIGALHNQNGHPERALAPLGEALEIWKAAGGDNREAGIAETHLGEALVALGRRREARAHLERALERLDGSGHEPFRTARAQFALAEAIAGREPVRAVELARSAERLLAADPDLNPNLLARVRRWLAARGGGEIQ